jgi:hypothetical protein
MVEHLLGDVFCPGCFLESDHSSDLIETLNSLREGSDEHNPAEIGFSAHYTGMVIAEY